ncbi:AAA family ATPase [Gordonia sp. DT30]|uniref:MinD/ParA family ATP-binding protein n=1 Tax=Gordonia sp. DT30 TaxID=3416546 RepID=UPI003CF76051
MPPTPPWLQFAPQAGSAPDADAAFPSATAAAPTPPQVTPEQATPEFATPEFRGPALHPPTHGYPSVPGAPDPAAPFPVPQPRAHEPVQHPGPYPPAPPTSDPQAPPYPPNGYAPNEFDHQPPNGYAPPAAQSGFGQAADFGPPAGFGQPTGFGPPEHQSGPALDEVALLRKARRPPNRGWRRAVHTISAGTINPGDSATEVRYQQLLERLRRPVRGDYRIAVLSLKGGVGKTTTTVGLGSTFASLRGDRVIAVDANPDLGTLSQRIPQQTASTVRNLLADDNVYRYSDVRAHTSQAPSRLEVLASERDPAMAEAFSEEEYRGVITILQRFYNIIITDCGTGLSHSAMNGVLDLANAIILVSSPALDGARSAAATLDWLEAHGHAHLVSRAVVVLSSSRPGSSTIDTDQLGQHFLTRCRAVQTIPFDDHLAEGADVDLELVSKPTRHAFVELAAAIADEFATTPGRREEPFYS